MSGAPSEKGSALKVKISKKFEDAEKTIATEIHGGTESVSNVYKHNHTLAGNRA